MDKKINYTVLGLKIRTAREKAYITQEQLGEKCSLSASHIGHIERGTRIPSLETLCKISETLGVSTDYLLFESFKTDVNMFSNISATLKKKDPEKVRMLMTVIRVLSEKIDEF